MLPAADLTVKNRGAAVSSRPPQGPPSRTG